MDFLDLAEHRFQELSSTLLRPMTTEASDAWEAWLQEDVSAVAAQLCSSQRFQHHASWSLTHLAPGSNQPQRRLVEAADRSLIAAASALREAAQRMSDGSSADPLGAELLSVIEWIAGRPWFDLACPEEFFTAHRGLHLVTTRNDCHSEFWASREPRVPLGDYVCRGMFMRLEYFAQKITVAWQRCFARFGHADYALEPELKLAWLSAQFAAGRRGDNLIDDRSPAHRHAHRAGLAAEFRLEANWQRTALPSANYPGHCLVASCGRRSLSSTDESEDLIDALRQEKRLVMVDQRPRLAYWDGELINYDWDANSVIWDLLWTAARRATDNKPVCEDDLLSPTLRGGKTLVHRRSRLSKSLPPMLDSLIEAVRPRGYRLVLAAEDIALLSHGSDDQLIDVGLDVTGRLR